MDNIAAHDLPIQSNCFQGDHVKPGLLSQDGARSDGKIQHSACFPLLGCWLFTDPGSLDRLDVAGSIFD